MRVIRGISAVAAVVILAGCGQARIAPSLQPKLYVPAAEGQPTSVDVDVDVDLSGFRNAKKVAKKVRLQGCEHYYHKPSGSSHSECFPPGGGKITVGFNPDEAALHQAGVIDFPNFTYVIGNFSFKSQNRIALEDIIAKLGDRPVPAALPELWADPPPSQEEDGLSDHEVNKLALELAWSSLTASDHELICLGYRTNQAESIDAFVGDGSDFSVPEARQFLARKCA